MELLASPVCADSTGSSRINKQWARRAAAQTVQMSWCSTKWWLMGKKKSGSLQRVVCVCVGGWACERECMNERTHAFSHKGNTCRVTRIEAVDRLSLTTWVLTLQPLQQGPEDNVMHVHILLGISFQEWAEDDFLPAACGFLSALL